MAIRASMFLLACVLSGPWAKAEDVPREAPGGWAVAYVQDLGPSSLHQLIGLVVDAESPVGLPADLDFQCTLQAPTPYDRVHLTLEVAPEGGAVHYSGDLTLSLAVGQQRAILRWPIVHTLENGVYDVRVTATRPDGHYMASSELRLRKFSEGQISGAIAEAAAAIGDLEAHVQQSASDAIPAAALHQLAIAGESLDLARTAWDDANWAEAYDRANEAAAAAASIRAGLTFSTLAPERYAPGASVSGGRLAIRNAAIELDGSPVYLFGVRMALAQAAYGGQLKHFGVNAVALELSPADVLPAPNVVLSLAERIGPILDACDDAHVAVALQLEPHRIPGWALDQWPEIGRTQFPPFLFDVTHPRALDVLEAFYRAVGAYVSTEPRILAVSLADAPRFRISDEPMRKGFAAYLAQRYASTVDLNLAWRTRLKTIEDVPIRWDWDKPGYQAHLQRYHLAQVTGFFSWMVDQCGGNTAGLPLMFTAPQSTFIPTSAKDGIDLEALNSGFVASGVESVVDAPPSPYALPFPDTQMQYALARSLHPEKPVFDFNAAIGGNSGLGDAQAVFPLAERARLWSAAMAGADFSVAAFETLFDLDAEIRPHDTRELAAYISGGESLNRLAPIVQAFQHQRAPVAIVWSDSSRIYEDGAEYLPSVRRAYEGVACFGLPVRFISERQLAAGELASVALLVVPDIAAMAEDAFDALERFIEDGGRLVSTGSSIPYDAYGTSRPSRLMASPLTKLVRGSQNPNNYLRAIDAAFDASDLEEFPRAIDDRRYPIPGVMSRYLAGDDGEYLYLVNLRHEPVRVHLPQGPRAGRDLIEGRPVHFPMETAPLDPMLIRLAPVEAGAESTPSDSPSSEIPTAIVEPVLQEDSDHPSL